jgi:molybdate transport system substrate-binding protein
MALVCKSRPLLALACAVAALAAVGLSASAAAAEVTVLANRAFQSAMQEIVPAFNRTGSDHASAEFGGPLQLTQRLKDGESVDVVVGPRVNIDELVKDGKVLPASVVDLARSYVAIAVLKGAPKPDIATAEALRRTLLGARAISVPGTGALSGAHFLKVLDGLGIADAIKTKIRHPTGGQFAADLLVSGEADLAVQTRSELLSVPGVELLAPLPHEFEGITIFSAGVPARAHQPDAGRALIKYLQTPAATAIIKAKAMEPIAKADRGVKSRL